MAKTKAGKPQVLSQSIAYGLINKFAEEKKSDSKLTQKIPVSSSVSDKGGKQMKVLKINKCTAHFLKPRLYGYMNIILSSFIPRWKMTQQPRYFFVLDGLPSETNTNQNEPDFAKNRKHDYLVPTLCFFESKEKYDVFHIRIKKVPTRSVKFQRLFARYAKGTFPLNRYAVGVSVEECTARIKVLLNNRDVKLPKSEVAKLGALTETHILCCSEHEIHLFSCNDQATRDMWVKKINRVVHRRERRLTETKDGLIRAKLSDVTTVESAFD